MTEKSNKAESSSTGKSVVKTDSGEKNEKLKSPEATIESSTKAKTKKETIKQGYPVSKMALLSLFLVLFVGGVAGYEFYLLQNQSKQDSELISSQNTLQSRLNRLEQEIQSTRSSLTAEDETLKAKLDVVTASLGRTTMAWRLAEVEYLLTVANHRLNLVHDLKTAIAVFNTADERLVAIGDPGLTSVRKTIANELNVLKNISEPDLTGMALTLGSLASEVERLPLIFKERVDQATGVKQKVKPENWRDIPAAVWEEIKGLVVIRRHQQPTEPLLPPEEAWFLHQNLKLKLEQSQLALLRQDTRLFRINLEEARTWIQLYFDPDSAAVKNTINTLDKMSKIELKPAIPDVSGSLRELRRLLTQRGVTLSKKGE